MKQAVLDALRAARDAHRPVVLATWIQTGDQQLLEPGGGGALADAVQRTLARDQAEVVDTAEGPVFLEPQSPPLRLIVVGAVHIAQALAPMAALAGFDVTIIDPRGAFATEARFPGVRRVAGWPDQALAELAPDARTALVTLTHDPKIDDPALLAVLASPAFYVGCLGSRKTQAGRLARLRELGLDDAALGRVRGPVGVPIGAQSPAEIAVSILADVIAALRGAPAIPWPPKPPAA